jgi:hypothetical protein
MISTVKFWTPKLRRVSISHLSLTDVFNHPIFVNPWPDNSNKLYESGYKVPHYAGSTVFRHVIPFRSNVLFLNLF